MAGSGRRAGRQCSWWTDEKTEVRMVETGLNSWKTISWGLQQYPCRESCWHLSPTQSPDAPSHESHGGAWDTCPAATPTDSHPTQEQETSSQILWYLEHRRKLAQSYAEMKRERQKQNNGEAEEVFLQSTYLWIRKKVAVRRVNVGRNIECGDVVDRRNTLPWHNAPTQTPKKTAYYFCETMNSNICYQ